MPKKKIHSVTRAFFLVLCRTMYRSKPAAWTCSGAWRCRVASFGVGSVYATCGASPLKCNIRKGNCRFGPPTSSARSSRARPWRVRKSRLLSKGARGIGLPHSYSYSSLQGFPPLFKLEKNSKIREIREITAALSKKTCLSLHKNVNFHHIDVLLCVPHRRRRVL